MKEDVSGVTLEHFLLEEAEQLVVEREQPAREQPGDDDDVIVIAIAIVIVIVIFEGLCGWKKRCWKLTRRGLAICEVTPGNWATGPRKTEVTWQLGC